MSTISLEGMAFHSYHGCLPEEKVTGNIFEVYIHITTDTSRAETTDDLKDTVNYTVVYNIVKKEMDKPAKLLEHIARRILDSVKGEIPEVESVKIKISKINPPVGGEVRKVSLTVSG